MVIVHIILHSCTHPFFPTSFATALLAHLMDVSHLTPLGLIGEVSANSIYSLSRIRIL